MSSREQAVHLLYTQSGGDPVNVDGINRALKDTMPSEGRPTGGRITRNGPFPAVEENIISLVATGGTPLVQWLPYGTTEYASSTVNHLSWVAPKGYDGTEEYRDFLSGIDIDPCGYGPSTSWSGFSYRQDGGSFSFKTDMMNRTLDDGYPYHKKNPIITVRGTNEMIGQQLTNDRDWAVAQLFLAMEQHTNYVVAYGDSTNSQMEWDGLDSVIRPGYVTSRVVGAGSPSWADPLFANMAGVNDVAAVLQAVRAAVRRIRNRLRILNWSLLPSDMVIVMPAGMWDQLAEYIAMGGMYRYSNQFGFTGQLSYADFRREYDAVRNGGIGFGTVSVDGTPVPVLVDPQAGRSVTIDPGGENEAPGILGNIYVLTRRAQGMELLSQRYRDWSKDGTISQIEENVIVLPGYGHVRTGWVTEANKCYYYFAEMQGRLEVKMMPLQARIDNVVVPVLGEGENETSGFYSPDFFQKAGLANPYSL